MLRGTLSGASALGGSISASGGLGGTITTGGETEFAPSESEQTIGTHGKAVLTDIIVDDKLVPPSGMVLFE